MAAGVEGSRPPSPGSKRRRVLAGDAAGQGALDGLWLRAACAAVASGRFPPRPDIELARRREVLKLRAHYEDQVREVCRLADAPRESFNRWLLARLNSPAGRAPGADPLLGGSSRSVSSLDAEAPGSPLGEPASAASVLHGELMAALPVQLPYARPDDAQGQRAALRLLASALLGVFDDCGEARELRAACAAAVRWAEAPEPACQGGGAAERLLELRALSAPLLRSRFHEAVCRLCSDLEHAADRAARIIAELCTDAAGAGGCKVSAVFDAPRRAYLLSLSDAAAADPGARLEGSGSGEEPESPGRDEGERGVAISEGPADAAFVISEGCMAKLSAALRQSARRSARAAREWESAGDSSEAARVAEFAKFLATPDGAWEILFCLLCRYDALFGPGQKEGGGFHAALPPPVFDAIAGTAGGPHVECFASPMLSRGRPWRYCSLFGDLDVFFGSLGSFLDDAFMPESFGGCFEVNPPFLPAVVVQMVDKILASLERAEVAGVALQFVAVLPGCSRRGRGLRPEFMPSSIERLFCSPFTRALMGRRRRHFMYGLSFKTDCQWPPFAVHSRIVLLQTTAAAASSAPESRGPDAEARAPSLLACLNEVWGHPPDTDEDSEAADVVRKRE